MVQIIGICHKKQLKLLNWWNFGLTYKDRLCLCCDQFTIVFKKLFLIKYKLQEFLHSPINVTRSSLSVHWSSYRIPRLALRFLTARKTSNVQWKDTIFSILHVYCCVGNKFVINLFVYLWSRFLLLNGRFLGVPSFFEYHI
jgi:hypothetical protein